MRPKGLENVPHGLEVTGLNRCLVVITILNEDGKDNRTLLLNGCPTDLPDRTTHSLNDLHLTAFGVNERNTIKGWHINTFC